MEAIAFAIVTIVAVFVFIGLFIFEDKKQKKQTKSGGSYEDLFKKRGVSHKH
jgi:preprotein translocase subunit SecG